MSEDTTGRRLPELSAEQRAENLRKAAQARHERAELLTRVKRGEVAVAEVIGEIGSSALVDRTRVGALVRACPGYGRARAARLLERLGLADGRRLRSLGTRQREALLEALSPND